MNKVLLLVLLLTAPVRGSSQDRLGESVGSFAYPQITPPELIRLIGERIGYPVGLMYSADHYPGDTVSFYYGGGTVKKLLESVAKDYGFTLDTSNEMLVFIKIDPRWTLPTIQLSFPPSSEMTRREAWDRVGQSAELKGWLEAQGCQRFEVDNGHRWEPALRSVTLPPSNTPLNEVLAAASRQAGSNFWYIIRVQRPSGCDVSIGL